MDNVNISQPSLTQAEEESTGLSDELKAFFDQCKGIAGVIESEPPTESEMERIWEGIGARQMTGTPQQDLDLSEKYGTSKDGVPSKEELKRTTIPSQLVYLDLQRTRFTSDAQKHLNNGRALNLRGENPDAELKLAQRALDKARQFHELSEELKRELASPSREM